MEQTLDSIRPSDVDGSVDMTYLCSRDPSILAYGQRPIPTKKNLDSLYDDDIVEYSDETRSTAYDSIALQTVKVYLRMKPFPRKLKLSKEETDAYQIINSTTLATKLPNLDQTCRSQKGQKGGESVCRRFTFSHTFGPETTQSKLFEDVIQQKMVDFLGGQNCTVMTYGTTNSGKSYTLQGTPTSPGIIPRGLEFVFSNINPRPTPCYKPTHNSNVICLNAVDRAQEIEAKNKLLTFAAIDKHHYIDAYKQMQKLLQEESPIRPSQACDAHYSVWVSFAEIYNENIYDLLSNDCQKRRPLLKLAADNHDRAFIKGLKTICVNSGSEAYQVLIAGQYNLKVAATALNARSSRSHCIFTIQLLKYYAENIPESVEISTFTFCDLAGSERLKKTLNVGDRLKEAQNINTSLLVLGRCLKSIYEGQTVRQRQEHIGPFRESKLTRLFQRALSGKEQIALIVNVNPLPNLYVETQNVLNFSAIAKKIVIEPKKTKRKMSNSRFSQICAQSVKSHTDWDPTELCNIAETSDAPESDSVFINPDDYDDLLDENERLKNEICALKASMLNKDLQIRQELAVTYSGMMKKLETDWKNRMRDVEEQTEDHLEWRVNIVETFYKDKLKELTSRKRRRTEDSCSDDDARDVTELEIENSRLQMKIRSLKKSVKQLRDANETMLTEKNKVAFEFSLANDELKNLNCLLCSAQQDLCKDDESMTYVEGLRKQLSEKQEHVKNLKTFLNEAKDEYINISRHAEMMEERLKERDEALAETKESVADLRMLLEDTNACLDEKTKATELLEETLNQQTNSMQKAKEEHRKNETKLMERVRELNEKIASLEKSIALKENIVADSNEIDIEIKKEILSESEGDVSTNFPKIIVPHGIMIKTDGDEILGIPSTTYDDDRESEMFVQVSEITLNENITDNASESANEKFAKIQDKLDETENENRSLKKKLSQNFTEVQSLKESLNSTKEQLNDITKKLKELTDAQDLEARTRENSLTMKTLEQRVSLKNCESQTNNIETSEEGNRTGAIVDSHESVQTSLVKPTEEDKFAQMAVFENEELINSKKLLDELEEKCSKLEGDCKDKLLFISNLEQQANKLRDINDSMEKKLNDERTNLAAAVAERDSLQRMLNESEEIRKKLEIQISERHDEHQLKITSLTNDIIKAAAEREELDKALVKTEADRRKCELELIECRNVHEFSMTNLKKELTAACERENRQSESIKVHVEKISELENIFALRAKEQEEKIVELNKCIEIHETEKKELEQKMTESLEKMEVLTKSLQQVEKRDQEKDEEIRQLQKSYKAHLAADIHDKNTDKELKKALKELAETEEALARTQELYDRMRAGSKKDRESFESLSSALEHQMEISEKFRQQAEKLETERDALKNVLNETELQMGSFKNNQEKMVANYDNLIKSLQDELDRARREITRFQELFHRMPITPRGKAGKSEEDDKKNSIPVVDLSDSESKKPRRRDVLPPPSVEVKRSTRKKKLYLAVDDSSVDLEVCDSVPPTPSPSASTRNLRNRKK